MDSLICDFCNINIPNDEGSAFCDGSAFSNVGIDERVSCAECCGKLINETYDD